MPGEERGEGLVLRDLGNGLILRRSRREDAEELAQFNARVFADSETQQPDQGVMGWVHDLMRGDHPTFRYDDFLLVEDTTRRMIVSSLCMISQKWSYDGIEFNVGRPELVGTHDDYRRRGLVRALFEELHRISALRGELLLGITGIYWYYRQFGYEYALDLGNGRYGFKPQVSKLGAGETEPYQLRPATANDTPFVQKLYEQANKRYKVVAVYNQAQWPYELVGRSDASDVTPVWMIIEKDGAPVGVLRHNNRLSRSSLIANFYEVIDGVSLLAVTPSVLRYMEVTGERYAAAFGKTWSDYTFSLGAEHPLYTLLAHLLPASWRPYAWYIRVPDLAAFITHVAPALERRLAASPLAGYSGELKLNFYRDGLRLLFENGRLTLVEQWQPTYTEDGSAVFSGLVFLQLLLGYRKLEELESSFPDCRPMNPTARALLNTLFPRQPSHVLPVS